MWSFWRRRKQRALIREAFGDFLSEQQLQEIEKAVENPSDQSTLLDQEAQPSDGRKDG
jgi:hypothetical protein